MCQLLRTIVTPLCLVLMLLTLPAGAADAPSPDADLAAAREAVKAHPDDVASWNRLGRAQLDSKAYDEALKSFAEALARNPRSGDARIGSGTALAEKGELDKAEAVLKEALKSPDPVRAHYELGRLYERRGDAAKAVAEYKEGIRKWQLGRH